MKLRPQLMLVWLTALLLAWSAASALPEARPSAVGADPATGANGDDDTADATMIEIFGWFHGGDWREGGLLAICGLIGALVTTFGWIGGAVPGTAGKIVLDEQRLRLKQLEDRLLQLVGQEPPTAVAIEAVGKQVHDLRSDIRRESWKQFWIGFALYVVVGACFASALADDLLDAIVLGAGWTAVLGTAGLKQDHQKRVQLKDDSLAQAQAVIEELQSDPHRPVGPGAAEVPVRALPGKRLDEIVDRISIALNL